jgi:transposase
MSTNGSEVSTCREVDTRQVRRRRRWPEAVKRRIVAETRESGASVSVVARRHDVNANQVFAWCRRYRDDGSGGAAEPNGLVPVSLVASAAETVSAGSIEVGFGGGIVVRVTGAVEAATLRQVLTVLAARPVCRSRGEER